MKTYTTNETFRKLFLSQNCTQLEMGYRTETDKHSVNDWLKNKNQLRFDKLEQMANHLGKRVKIVIEDKPIHKFNGSLGATLCNKCSVIITTGLTDDLYCNKCKQETLECGNEAQAIRLIEKYGFEKQEQDKKMYSEEDLREAFKQSRQCKIFEKDMPPVHESFEEWIKQFKKNKI